MDVQKPRDSAGVAGGGSCRGWARGAQGVGRGQRVPAEVGNAAV